MSADRRDDRRGQALVEFALTIPIVILLMVGLFDLGRVVFINNSLSDGARHGARHAATDPRDPGYCAAVETAIRSSIRGQSLDPFAGTDGSRVDYEVVSLTGVVTSSHRLCQVNAAGSFVDGPGKATLPTVNFTHPGRDRVTVTLETSVDLITPFVAAATGASGFELGTSSTMVITYAP